MRFVVATVTLVSLLGACAGGTPPSPEAPPAPASSEPSVPVAHAPMTKRETPPPCLPKAIGAVAHVELSGRRATACYATEGTSGAEGGATPCLVVELDSGKVVEQTTWTAPVAPDTAPETSSAFQTTVTDTSVEVCARESKKCATVRVQHKPSKAGHGGEESKSVIAATSADGTRVFVFAPTPSKPNAPTTVYGDIYETKTGTRVSHVKLTGLLSPMTFSDESDSWSAEIVGKNVIVRDQVCCGPGGATFLLDPTQQKLQLLHSYDGELTQLKGSLHLVRDSKELSLVDLDKLGVLVKFTLPGEGLGNPEHAEARVAVDSGSVFAAYANPPGFVTIDPDKRTASAPVSFPVCP